MRNAEFLTCAPHFLSCCPLSTPSRRCSPALPVPAGGRGSPGAAAAARPGPGEPRQRAGSALTSGNFRGGRGRSERRGEAAGRAAPSPAGTRRSRDSRQPPGHGGGREGRGSERLLIAAEAALPSSGSLAEEVSLLVDAAGAGAAPRFARRSRLTCSGSGCSPARYPHGPRGLGHPGRAF